MADFQRVGDKQKLSKGPKNYDRSRFGGGQFGMVGDSVTMSSKPVPIQSGNKHISGGSYQQVGDAVPLSPTPHKGWDSHATPMSDRSIKQSDMPGFSKARGRKY